MINQVILQGRLGRDPGIFMTQQGRQIAKFSLATSSTWKDETGEWQTKTHWHSIVIHRASTISWLNGVLKQGDLARVEGRLTYHYWTDDYGRQRRKAQVVVSEQYGKLERPTNQNPHAKPRADKSDDSSAFEEDSDQLDLTNIPFLAQQPNQCSQPNEGETL